MADTAKVELSVILVTPDAYSTIQRTVRALAGQTICERMELVIVGDSKSVIGEIVSSDVARFGRVLVVEVGAAPSKGTGNAAGVRAATAAIVVMAEDHCFPEPTWAAELVEAHKNDWSAVAPVIVNANPSSAISWADLLLGYGLWTEPATACEMDFLPGHNTSYKRDAILAYGERLSTMLNAETVMHWDMRAKGHRLYFHPPARAAHVNYSKFGAWTATQYLNGRIFAAGRARTWSADKRAAFALLAWLVPAVRFIRLRKQIIRRGRPVSLLRVIPAVMYGLAVDGLGQFVGCVFGCGDAVRRFDQYEFHRYRHVRAADVTSFAPLAATGI